MEYPAGMRTGWTSLVVLLLGATLPVAVRAQDDVAAILADLSATEAPCAGQIQALDDAVALDPTNQAARLARGVCLYRLGRLESARTDLDQALDPVKAVDAVEALAVGAILAARNGDAARAEARLSRARKVAGAKHPQVLRGSVVVQGVLGDFPGAWSALDRALDQSAEDPILRTAATELIALDPDGATDRARAAVGRRVKSVTRHNRASGWLNAGQPAACLHEAEGALAEADPEDTAAIASLHELAWTCGVAAEQVGPATRHLKAMGRAALADQPAGTVIAHVRLLRDADQGRSALKMLSLVQPVSAADLRDVATLGVTLRTEQGDLDTALQLATDTASPVSRANLAKALHAAGRTADAVSLLDRTCPQLDDPAACRAWADHLRSQQ